MSSPERFEDDSVLDSDLPDVAGMSLTELMRSTDPAITQAAADMVARALKADGHVEITEWPPDSA